MSRFHEFLAELKTRHVYRVAVVYGLVAWFVIQAASIVVPELDLPAWITRVVIIASLLGLPIALALAWAYEITPHGDRSTAPAAPERSRGRLRLFTATVVLLLLAIGVTAYSMALRSGVPHGEALREELRQLVDAGDWAGAFDLAQQAIADGESLPDTLTGRFTDRLTVVSDPPGAHVFATRFVAGATEPLEPVHLGLTPLRGVPVARGDYMLRIEADGYASAERPASGTIWRLRNRNGGEAEVMIEVGLLPADRVPQGMIFVPGGRYQIASRDLQSLTATLEDYFIDRLEVTNASFAEFVDGGGYTRDDLWTELREAMRAGAADPMAAFVDRAGLAAPRDWTGQQPPAGLGDHPVTGVSWYEAAAYCRFRDVRLPTLFEWERAARNGARSFHQGIELPWGYVGPQDPATERANFSRSGTTRVGSFPFGLSAYGALDMAGNAKEWLYNRSGDDRAVTGGSWADPVYVFSQVGAMHPAAATGTVGFRCARAADPATRLAAQGDGPLRLEVESPVYEAVDEATFRSLLGHYQYDPRPLNAVVEERVEESAWTRERITYDGPDGDRVVAYLFLPKTGRPPYQTVVYVPSSVAFFGNSVAFLAQESLGPLVRTGRALFSVVMKGMTERPFPPDFELPETYSVAFRDMMVQHGIELRLGLDYLETRADIDAGRLAYAGTSWGAGSRLPFAAIDDRFRAVVLIGAGIDERIQPTLPEASNINFAPYIRAPKLVVNGREDDEHPWLTRGLPLWHLLREPKELALFDGVGHVPPVEMRIPVIRDFLDRQLGTR